MNFASDLKGSNKLKYGNINLSRFWGITNVVKIVTIILLITLGAKYHQYLNPSTIASFAGRYGVITPLLFIILCGVKPVLFFLPTMGLAIVGGILFGPIWGMVYVAIGGAFSTATGFYFARWLGRDAIKHLGDISKRMRQMDSWTNDHGRNTVLSIRLFNMPWDIVSYWAGVSNIQFKDFYIASMIPLIPISFLYTYLGSKILTPRSWGFIVSISIMFILGTIPFIRQKLRKRTND